MAKQTITHKDRAAYLRCLIYDLYVLATAVREVETTTDYALNEIYKAAALLKLRAVHDFFFRLNASDSIKLSMFKCYNPTTPQWNPLNRNTWLTRQSINTYVAHLDKARVTKKYEREDRSTGKKKGDSPPQPKFDRGDRAVINASKQLMGQAKEFVESVLTHKEFAGLNDRGKGYWVGFQAKLAELCP